MILFLNRGTKVSDDWRHSGNKVGGLRSRWNLNLGVGFSLSGKRGVKSTISRHWSLGSLYTQVLREHCLRNSANWYCNFERRYAARLQKRESSDCFSKTQDFAKAKAEVLGLRPARCCFGEEEKFALWIDISVNGGCNSNGPEVAKFLDG